MERSHSLGVAQTRRGAMDEISALSFCFGYQTLVSVSVKERCRSLKLLSNARMEPLPRAPT